MPPFIKTTSLRIAKPARQLDGYQTAQPIATVSRSVSFFSHGEAQDENDTTARFD
jgi:hypothetical protein